MEVAASKFNCPSCNKWLEMFIAEYFSILLKPIRIHIERNGHSLIYPSEYSNASLSNILKGFAVVLDKQFNRNMYFHNIVEEF